jgi:amino acid adenylation domain-containing protein
MTQRLLHDSLLASAARHPAKAALVADGATVTYAELLERSLALAAGLQELGVLRGDRVAVYMDNSAEAAVGIFATLLAGGVMVVVNPQTKEDKLAYLLSDCEAAVLLADGRQRAAFSSTVTSVPSLRAVVGPDAQAAAAGSPAESGTIPVDLAAIIYTSGSTGRPKGVMMTHQSMVFAAGSIAEYLRLGPDERILNVLPLAFDYGLYQLLMSVRLGATLVLERSFAFPARTVEVSRSEDVTVFPGVPTVFATLLSMAARQPFALPGVTRVTNTGAALPPAFREGLRTVFPTALVFAMYGLTECKRVSYLEPELFDAKPSSVGRAIPGTETLVLGPDGEPVGPGQPGILHVRGPHVMLGYWRAPELTARMLVEGPLPGERMLCTHDHFTVDEEGLLYFVGRTDDIIKTRGEKVSPAEVEDVLYGLRGIREAAVVGVPDELLGEAVRAFVALDDPGLERKEILAACRARLEPFMVPREIVVLEELPKTSSGKISKNGLRQLAAATS